MSEFFTVHLKNLLSITTLADMVSAQTFTELIDQVYAIKY